MADLLLELFSEEIPAGLQKRACADLQKMVTNGLVEAGLTYASAATFATPRRLCLTVDALLAESPSTREERKGPRVDAPEQALNGFLRGAGLTKDQLEIRDDKKGQTYYAVIEKAGRPASEIVAEVVTATIRNFPWSKSMRWGTGSLRWVRPLHSILCILSAEDGTEVVDFEIDGIQSANLTAGHRFLAPEWFSVNSFEQYQVELKQAFVVLDAQERADHIWEDAKNMAFAQGLELVEDAGLLAEVAGLVEWPVVLMGDIADDFLNLPPEVLITSMKEHQKFFSVKNPKTGRIEKFVTVANRTTADNGATILAGNQKVLFARLSDAKFFWENDLRIAKAGMGEWTDKLQNVTFHNKLGTQAERIDRIAALAGEIAPLVGADAELATQAAKLAKADLSSEMVGEFAKLQGLMGRYYAAEAGLPAEVGAASQEHYSPLGPTDVVPTAPVSVAVAMADKIDTLTGFWAIDEKPTGSKDPFALRRAALGVIRLVLENDVRCGIESLLNNSILALDPASWLSEHGQGVYHLGDRDSLSVDTANDLLSFFHDRLKVYLKDAGISHDVIDACLAMPNNDDFTLLVKRAQALQDFRNTDDGENLLQGFKRANNILTAEEKKDGVSYEGTPEMKFAEEDVERALFAALDANEPKITDAISTEDFAAAMTALAALRSPIDAFFDAVQVNADTQIVRRNRLCLLNRIRAIMGVVSDFTLIEG
jgi:glycyl-tRNA synthetase beta chain